MKFCPNCGSKLPIEGAKFCPECGTSLKPPAETKPEEAQIAATKQQKSDRAFELLKKEISKKAADHANEIAKSLIEKWKASGKYPRRFGEMLSTVIERGLPAVIQAKLTSVEWQNESSTETAEGQLETAVSTSFPVELETHIPLVGKISITKVRLTMRGTVDILSENVSQLKIGAVDLA